MKRYFPDCGVEESPTDGTVSVTSPESTEDSLEMCWPGPLETCLEWVWPPEEDADPVATGHPGPGRGSSPTSLCLSSQRGSYMSPPCSLSPCIAPAAPPSVCALYTLVRTVRGVAVAWETESGFQPTQRQPRVRGVHFLGRPRRRGCSFDVASATDLCAELEACDAVPRDQDGGSEDEDGDLGERRAPPDSLVTTGHGLRCMACCRVFPTLHALLEHARHGICDGFSCQIFFQKLWERQQARAGEQDTEPTEQEPQEGRACPPARGPEPASQGQPQ
ncbi:protein FAM170B [Ctenodactylus gundi]